jgi:hypothetical protein
MRIHLVIVALLIAAVPFGCGKSNDNGVEPLIDGGFDGGTDGGRDGGVDGGLDGGIDGGIDAGVCVNTVEMVPQQPRFHIPDDQTPIYNHNPPVQGMHYDRWAHWRSYTETIPRGHWVHNLEHGAVVFLYHPDAGTELVQALTRIYDAIPDDPTCDLPPNNIKRVLLTPDPLLDAPWAVTVAGREPDPPLEDGGLGFGFSIKANCIADAGFLVQFAVEHRNMSAEPICDDGQVPPY